MENQKSGNKREPEEKADHPFVNLRGSDIRGDTAIFYSVPGKPDMVVRKSFVNVHGEGSEQTSIQERAEYLRHQAVEFRKIMDRMGIRMAKTDYVIGTDPETDKPSIFGVTDRIEGESFDKIKILDKETAEKIDDLYAKIIADNIDSYLKNSYSWYDPKNEQFMLGKAPGDEKPNIYLVDVDPNIFKWDNHDMQKKFNIGKEGLFWQQMRYIFMAMDDMGRKVDEKGFKFEKARKEFERAKMEIPNL